MPSIQTLPTTISNFLSIEQSIITAFEQFKANQTDCNYEI
jgi:hypothetical protein